PDLRFAGNVEIGRDLSWDELADAYDAVIVATGMVIDKKLGVPGEGLPQVWGSWRVVAWPNGHPGFRPGADLSPGRCVAIIGNGNVALDVARVLAKSADEMAKSDIVPEAGAAIAAAPLTDLYVIGRRGPENASFTNTELAEMGRLARAVAVTDAKGLDVAPPAGESTPERLRRAKNLQILQGFAKNQPGSKPVTLHFIFNAAPLAFAPGEVTLTTGKLAADFCGTCIGYGGEDFPRRAEFFPVGWARRGPTGTIPTNRAESHAVAKEVLAWLAGRDPKSGPDILPAIVDAAGWHRIDKHEIAAAATTGRPPVKLTDWQALLDIAQRS